MDQQTLINAALVLAFVLVGGVFAGTEIALVSLRESQVSDFEKRGGRAGRVAHVARQPNRFLAAVQIGVTVAGFFSAAYGASTLAPDFAPFLVSAGLPEAAADTAALVLLTLVVAYVSLVLGELVPKRIALQRSAGVALVVGPPLDRFANLMRPVIWLLSKSTDAVVRLVGGDPHAASEEMSEDELRYMVDQHEGLGESERQILVDVFDAGDRTLVEVMRPRADVTVLRVEDTVAQAFATIRDNPFSRYPVIGRDVDDVRGFVHVRDLFGADPDDPTDTVEQHLRAVTHLPGTNRVLPTLTWMRKQRAHLAVVVDEYGGTDGIVTLEDLVEELVGEIDDEYDDPATHQRSSDDGEVDAALTIEEFAAQTGVELADGPYETAAGYVLHRLGRIPDVGDDLAVGGHTLVVTGREGARLTRLSVKQVEPDPGAGTATTVDA
ncbi:hemolysin family protein [Nocardioides kribbensis]|uniref:Hemolysin family protein n=1 Tax=Nocardioides kribbensis TaxID=305517 RepID=A0ABV1NV73_9ACTN